MTYIAQAQLELRISDASPCPAWSWACNASDAELGSGIVSSGGSSGGIIGEDLASNATASDEPSPERVAKESLTALYALFMSVWAALFVERWKRRAKLLCLDWDVIGQGASANARLPLHPKFKEDAVKEGFYTAEGDWVDLDKSKLKVNPSPIPNTPTQTLTQTLAQALALTLARALTLTRRRRPSSAARRGAGRSSARAGTTRGSTFAATRAR